MPFVPEPPKVDEFQDLLAANPFEAVSDRRWSRSDSSKHREKDYEWESTGYSSHSRSSSSKYEDDYRSSKKYYEGRKERDYGGKYSSNHRDDYERDRHKRDKSAGRKDRDRGKYSYHSSRSEDYDRDKSKRDKERYSYNKSYSKNDAYRMESSTDFPPYPSSSYGYDYPYPQTASSSWAPPPEESPPRPPPEPSNEDGLADGVKDDSLRNKKPGDDDENTVDLDTRIAMLFKSKSFGSDAPSLFQLNEESNGEAKQGDNESASKVDGALNIDGSSLSEINLKKLKIQEELSRMEEGEITETKVINSIETSPISTIPSPYESRKSFIANRKHYKSRKHKKHGVVESGASDISSSEDELLAKGSYSPPLPSSKIKIEDMSLSSLSSSEPIKEEIVKSEIKAFDSSSAAYPVGFSSYDAAYYYQNSFHNFQQPNLWSSGGDHDTSGYQSRYKKSKASDDPHEVAVKKVIDKLILELKQILKKDVNKRMIENTAFKKYEAWYEEQERSKNTRIYHDTKEFTPVQPSVEPAPLQSYQQSGGLGILRNLRFQRIKREPAPKLQEEDSRKSDPDDDDMVHGSDSEKEDLQQTSKTSFIKRKISASSSSESSESSDSSSDEDAEEEEKDDHAYSSDTASIMSDDELTVPKQPKKELDNNCNKLTNIYSDSDSDLDEVELQKPTIKSKLKIYSESEDDEEEPAPPGTANEKEEEESDKKSSEEKSSTPAQPAESDSDFFNDDVISKPPRTPGRISSDDQNEKDQEKQSEVPKKPVVEPDRVYSDSEEERDYQEKIRKNTEWMEQKEREEKEQLERERLQQKDNIEPVKIPAPQVAPKLETKDSSFDEVLTPKVSLPPPTPGAQLKFDSFNSKDQEVGKKKRGRPKGSTGKTKEPKKPKNSKIEAPFAQPHPSSKSDVEQKYSLKLSPFSSDGGSSHASLVALEHCYSLPPSASPSLSSSSPHDHQDIHMDHDYCGKSDVTPLQSIQPGQLDEQVKKEQSGARPVGRPRKDPNAPKAQYTKKDKNAPIEKHKPAKEKIKTIDLKQHQSMVENFVPVARFNKRSVPEEYEILYRFVTKGIDQEDIDYMRKAHSDLIKSDMPGLDILHQVHWVDHCATDRSFDPSPPKKRRKDNNLPEMKVHETGSARTEGFYKVDSKVKAHYKYHHLRGTVAGSHLDNSAKMAVAKMQNASREARSNQRRLLTAFAGATESDLLKFNQLKFRKKQLKFAKSAIHDWGLFAMEPIAADEMVIEYVGQMIRPVVADLRETKYEAIGIGSSYLFRIDLETIIDATKCGNLARFINHSCNVSVHQSLI